MLPRLPAPTAVAFRRPAMMVSTMPMAIHPSSVRASGAASLIMGPSSFRRVIMIKLFGFGVGLVVDGHQIDQRDLRVFLCGGKARVSQQLLDRAEIGAVGQQVRGVGVAEAVRVSGIFAAEG